MIVIRAIKDLVRLLQQHGTVAVLGFGAGVVLWLAAGTLWPKQYRGSAVIALNPQALLLSSGDSQKQRQDIEVQLRQAIAHQDWTGIVTQFHLYPDLVVDSGLPHAAAYLATQVSTEAIADPGLGGQAIRVGYQGTDRDVVLKVTEAAAVNLTGSAMANPLSSSTSPSQASLYAPVILPDEVPVEKHPRGKAAYPAAARKGNPSASVDLISRELQTSVDQEAKLQESFNQNLSALDGLREELKDPQKAPAVVVRKASPSPTVERKATLQEERLHQEIAKAQRELAELRERYTDEYPDVVAANQKVHDLQLDLSRIIAATPPTAIAKTPAPNTAEDEPRTSGGADPAIITRQIADIEAVQSKLLDVIERNHQKTARLRQELAAAGITDNSAVELDDQAASTTTLNPNASANAPAPAARTPSINSTQSPFYLAHQASVSISPIVFATQFLWPLSLLCGAIVALAAAWVAERRDPSIRSEEMLRHELPASAVYLGRIPRIRHEVIVD